MLVCAHVSVMQLGEVLVTAYLALQFDFHKAFKKSTLLHVHFVYDLSIILYLYVIFGTKQETLVKSTTTTKISPTITIWYP